MEILLSLNQLNEKSGVVCPRLTVLSASKFPAKRIFQGAALQSVFLLSVLWLASTWTPTIQNAFDHLDASPQHITSLYYPPPAKKRTLEISRQRPKSGNNRRLLPPPKLVEAVVEPVLEIPPVVDVPAQTFPPLQEKGFPIEPVLAPALRQVRTGVANATAPVPTLEPSPHRAASVPLHAANIGIDSLGSTGTRSGGLGHAPERIGPPDLSIRPQGPDERQRLQRDSPTFTKPVITFMPKPAYPPAAFEQRLEGDVSILVTFDKDGHIIFRRFILRVENAKLNSVAREAVERIRFKPATRDRVNVDQDSVVMIVFRLNNPGMTASF
jgi:TonB family protein